MSKKDFFRFTETQNQQSIKNKIAGEKKIMYYNWCYLTQSYREHVDEVNSSPIMFQDVCVCMHTQACKINFWTGNGRERTCCCNQCRLSQHTQVYTHTTGRKAFSILVPSFDFQPKISEKWGGEEREKERKVWRLKLTFYLQFIPNHVYNSKIMVAYCQWKTKLLLLTYFMDQTLDITPPEKQRPSWMTK